MRAFEAVRIAVVWRVFVVRREDRVAALVVARVDDQVHRLFDPLGGFLGAHVVEDQDIRVHHRAQDVHLRGADERVVGAADHAQQIARVVEEPAGAFGDDDTPQHRDREMRLADARRSDQAQTLLGDGKFVGEAPRLSHRAEQLLVRVSDKGFEIAAAVARRNPRFVEQPRRQPFTPAVTSLDPATTVDFHRLPTGVVANRASHLMSIVEKTWIVDHRMPERVIVSDCRSWIALPLQCSAMLRWSQSLSADSGRCCNCDCASGGGAPQALKMLTSSPSIEIAPQLARSLRPAQLLLGAGFDLPYAFA